MQINFKFPIFRKNLKGCYTESTEDEMFQEDITCILPNFWHNFKDTYPD